MQRNIIKKDNALINASYTLTLAEQRLILLSIASAAGNQDELKAMSVHASLYAERFNVSIKAAYAALNDAAKQLFERRFSYQKLSKKGNLTQVHSRWVQSIEYTDFEATVRLKFADDVLPLLCELQNKFTSYNLNAVSALTSVYAIRLYELLISWSSTLKTPFLELAELRLKLGLAENEYERMSNFKNRVLDFAVKQINENSDIVVEYEQHKKGRSIVGFSFRLKHKDKPSILSNSNKSGKTEISIEQANLMAHRGETYQEAYERLSKAGYYIKGLR